MHFHNYAANNLNTFLLQETNLKTYFIILLENISVEKRYEVKDEVNIFTK